jgi:hypothetical protein
MSILIAAMLLAAQQATPADAAAPAAQKKKTQQICEMVEVTGSRARKRVCRDESGRLDLGPGVSDNAFGKARIEQGRQGSAPSAPGGSI